MGCVNSTRICGKCYSIQPYQIEHIISYSPMKIPSPHDNKEENPFSDLFTKPKQINHNDSNKNINILSTVDKENNQYDIRINEPKQSTIKEFAKDTTFSAMKSPKLKFIILTNSQSNLIDEVEITPTTLKQKSGNVINQQISHHFSFGKSKDNDCVLQDSNIADKQFYVFYNQQTSKFNLTDNKDGTGVFAKVETCVMISNTLTVSFQTDCIEFQVKEIDNMSKQIIGKFLQGKRGQTFCFNSENKNIITMGRDSHCDIPYIEDSVSKIQFTLKFEDDNWFLYDGSVGNKHKKSTNGLWQLAFPMIELKDKMLLTTGAYKIQVEIKETD